MMTFADYCIECDILSPEAAYDYDTVLVAVMWDCFGGEYIQYCMEQQLQFEDLTGCFSEEDHVRTSTIFGDEGFYESDS
ncbi:MAG: hypothetical protein WCP79_04450 [Bacillota bacterium]